MLSFGCCEALYIFHYHQCGVQVNKVPYQLIGRYLSIFSPVYMANQWSTIDWHNFKGIIIIILCFKLVDLLSGFKILSILHNAATWCKNVALHYLTPDGRSSISFCSTAQRAGVQRF